MLGDKDAGLLLRPFQGSPLGAFVPRVALRCTLGYDPVLTGNMVNNFSRETLVDNNVSMPWKETHAMDQRMKFILEWKEALESKTELCRRYGIQRRIGYKWV